MNSDTGKERSLGSIDVLPDTTELPAFSPIVVPPNARWLRWGGTIGRFASVQVIVQIVNAITGLLLVRLLNKHDYALFTIASSMQTMVNLFTDCGINAGLLSIGGRIWQDRSDFGQLVHTALRIRRQLSVAAIIIVSPISIWLLLKNGASILEAAGLTAVVISAVHFLTAAAVFGVVTKLNSRYSEIQRVELSGAFSRLSIVMAGALVFLNVLIATVASTVSQAVQFSVVRRQARRLIPPDSRENPEFRRQLVRMIRSQVVYFVFYAVQGQLSVVLISTFGSAGQVADVGALSRLALVGAVFGAVVTHVVSPAFARVQDKRHLWRVYAQALFSTCAFGLSCTAFAFVFAPQILWVFGSPYGHLTREVGWMMINIALGLVLMVIWGLNTARGWLHATWMMVPLTLVAQVGFARWLTFSTVHGVILFSIVSQLPNLLVSAWMTARGFARFQTMPWGSSIV